MAQRLGGVLPSTCGASWTAPSLLWSPTRLPLLTVDEGGWPHPSILSYFEVVAKDVTNVRPATYGGSTTTVDMRCDGSATLILIGERVAYDIKGRTNELAGAIDERPENAKTDVRGRACARRSAGSSLRTNSYIAHGINFQHANRSQHVERARRIIAELLEQSVILQRINAR